MFPETGELWARERVQFLSQSSTLALLRLRSSAGASLLTVQLSSSGLLQYVDELHALTRSSTLRPTFGAWHTVDLHVVIGTAGRVELSLDGVPVLAGQEDLGGLGVVRAYLGETNSNHTGEQVLDDVYVGQEPPPDGPSSTSPVSGVDTTALPRALTSADLAALRAEDGSSYTTSGTWGGTDVGTTGALTGVACPAAASCWITAAKGFLSRTTDGGRTWSPVAIGTTQDLTAVAVGDTAGGLAVGKRGTLLATTDAGTSWRARSVSTTKDLLGVTWLDGTRAVAVGASGTVLTTDDSGTTWTARSSGTSRDLTAVTAMGPSEAVAVGLAGTVLRTTDAGRSWSGAQVGSRDLLGVAARGQVVVAVGKSKTVLMSADGGNRWVSGTAGAQDLTAVAAGPAARWWVVGRKGTVLTSSDDAQTWTSQDAGTGSHLAGIASPTNDTAYVVGESGTVRTTGDAGLTWRTQPPAGLTWQFAPSVTAVSAVRVALAYAATASTPSGTSAMLWATTDGQRWSAYPLPTPATAGTTALVDLTADVGGDPNRLSSLQVRFAVTTPVGSALRTRHDLVRLDVTA